MSANETLLTAPEPSADWGSTLRLGYATVFLTFGVCGGWAAVAPLASAVVASGTISNETNRRTIQHLEGGIVSEILVRDGSAVREGDVLVRLDATRNEAVGDLHRKQLASAMAIEARLAAQRDMADAVTFPKEVTDLSADPLVAGAIADNRLHFQSRRQVLIGNLGIIDTQVAQVEKELQQSTIERKTAEDQLASLDQELPGLRMLFSKGLVAINKLTTLERDQLKLQGVVSSSTVALSKGADKIAELRARAQQLRQEYRQDAANALPELGKTIGDLRQQSIISADTLKRIDIRAPTTGTVQQLRIFTIGGVVRPGEPILDVIPAADTLVIRAKIAPIDIDRLRTDLPVEIRLPQFTRFHSAVIRGRVRNLSRDSINDEATKQPVFAMEATVERSTIPAEIIDRLVAGMNVDVIVPTQERTALQFIVSPMVDRLSTAMRER